MAKDKKGKKELTSDFKVKVKPRTNAKGTGAASRDEKELKWHNERIVSLEKHFAKLDSRVRELEKHVVRPMIAPPDDPNPLAPPFKVTNEASDE